MADDYAAADGARATASQRLFPRKLRKIKQKPPAFWQMSARQAAWKPSKKGRVG
jgi:hypothetical protein